MRHPRKLCAAICGPQREVRLARQREYDHARRNRTRRNGNANPEANPQGNPLHLGAVLDYQGKLRFGVPEEVYLGPMDVVCRNCGALHFRDEAQRQPGKSSFSECSISGEMDPDFFDPALYPSRLQQLFDDPHFLSEIRSCNSAMHYEISHTRPPV